LLIFVLLLASNAWAAGGAEMGMIAGAIVGSIVGTLFMWRIHPILGILTAIGAIGALAATGRMLSQ
jgi:hypothetical protein